jgi:hypothetical protein
MSDQIKLILAVVLCVVGFFGENLWDKLKDIPNNIPKPSPVVNVDEPTLEYKTVVKDIVAIDIKPEDATLISCFFLEVADIVKNDAGLIKTTGQFREFNSVSGGLNFNDDLKNKYTNLGEAIDSAIVSCVGKEDAVLDETKRNSLVKCLQAVAWGVKQ